MSYLNHPITDASAGMPDFIHLYNSQSGMQLFEYSHQLIQIYFIVNILKNVTQLKLFGNSLDEVFTLKINHK